MSILSPEFTNPQPSDLVAHSASPLEAPDSAIVRGLSKNVSEHQISDAQVEGSNPAGRGEQSDAETLLTGTRTLSVASRPAAPYARAGFTGMEPSFRAAILHI